MADIELVIKIDEYTYKLIQDKNYCGILSHEIYNAIQNGTPLPKGHGGLIDIQDVMKKVSLNYNSHQIIDAQSIKDIIRTTKIIIAADKEE